LPRALTVPSPPPSTLSLPQHPAHRGFSDPDKAFQNHVALIVFVKDGGALPGLGPQPVSGPPPPQGLRQQPPLLPAVPPLDEAFASLAEKGHEHHIAHSSEHTLHTWSTRGTHDSPNHVSYSGNIKAS
jgi:hypothetical protein